jgi:hypothetical protein
VTALESNGAKTVVRFDPASVGCRQLAGELADEWVELVTAADMAAAVARRYKQSIREFCEHVDASVPRAREASLGCASPDLHHAVTEWVALLPARYPAGSRAPGLLAGELRTLVRRRIEHRERPVAGLLHGWVGGHVGVRRGQSREVDEFTLVDKRKLVQAAWRDRIAIEARIAAGWRLAAAGSDPARAGWQEPANLLWALANGVHSCAEISAHLPSWADMPPGLRVLVGEVGPRVGKRALLRYLVRQLFLSNLDLQPYRVLLIAATGRASEEVTGLDEHDIEYGPQSVTIDFSKARAHAETRKAFSTAPEANDVVLHPSVPRIDAAQITRSLLELSRPLAQRVDISPVPLFLRASLHNSSLRAAPLDQVKGGTLTDWLRAHGLQVSGTVDIRRLRKSGKVEKAIAFKGRISDIADDHSERTFAGHYAHGTTLRVIAGSVITAAQQRWFIEALNGPLVLSGEAERSLDEPGSAAALGLSAQEVEALRSGELDMGVSSCKDPFASPYGRLGQLCPVAPSRCLECRNAFVLPSNLPQLLLFAEHLEGLRLRLSPRHFHALWGQSRANVREAIASRSDAEVALARRQIAEQGLGLQLPLASHVEFDA